MDWTEQYFDFLNGNEDPLVRACREALLANYNKRIRYSSYAQWALTPLIALYSYMSVTVYYFCSVAFILNIIFALYNITKARKYLYPTMWEVKSHGKSERILDSH